MRVAIAVAVLLVAGCSGEDEQQRFSCIPGAASACDCAGGRDLGTAICGEDGTPGACVCPGPCDGGSDVRVSGRVVTERATVALVNEAATVQVFHKRDVDAGEGGCVIALYLSVGVPGACRVDLGFGPNLSGGGWGLRQASFHAGSLCPGFPDAVEGSYHLPRAPRLDWFEGLVSVPSGEAEKVCVPDATVTFSALPPLLLRREDGASLVVDLSGLVVSGAFETWGDFAEDATPACPPALSCPAAHHDGGDRWCVPEGTCSLAFHDDGFGACVPEGTCARGMGLAEDGTCVSWAPVGAPVTSRAYPEAVALADGRVLVAGGYSPKSTSPPTATAELFAGGAFTATGAMATAREGFTLTALEDGDALAVGGFGPTGDLSSGLLATSERYDAATGTWRFAGRLATPRYDHAAVPISNGRVLVIGGEDDVWRPLATTEIWSPVDETWRAGPALPEAMWRPVAVVLPDGRVLAVCGATGVILDAAATAWTSVGASYPWRYGDAAAAVTGDGRVLLAAGGAAQAVLFDPATGAWSAAGFGPAGARATATTLPGGAVLVVGGGEAIFDPATGSWTDVPAPVTGRAAHAAALADGRVLVVGGYDPLPGTADLFVGRFD
jgi:hypothetical protein